MFVKIIRNAETQHGYGTQYWWTGLRDPDDDHIWMWNESKDPFKNKILLNPNNNFQVRELRILHFGILSLNQMKKTTIA